jgi:hypothetical protein
MAVQTKKFEMGIHTISYEFDDAKPWTEQDEALEKKHIALAEREKMIRDMMYDSLKKYSPIDKEIQAVRAFLMLIKDLAKDARDEADFYVESMMQMEDYGKELMAEKVQTAVKAFEEYHKKLLALEPGITKLSAFINKYVEMDEDMTEWDKHSKVKGRHYKNWKDNSIDICSFDREMDRFHAFVSVNKDSNSGIYRLLDGYILDYNKLMLETEAQYGIWEEFAKRVELLNKMVKVKVPAMNPDDLNLN